MADATLTSRTPDSLVRLAQVLEVAVEYGLIPRNPAVGKRRRLKADAPDRPWLDTAEQIAALLDAAREVDAESPTRQRRAALATLMFGGLRVGELLALRWRDVDLAAGRLTVREAKTAAGVRQVDLLPALRDELTTYRMDVEPEGFVFPTRKGRRQNAENLRKRMFAPAVEKANLRLGERELAPLPERLTPHALRRTFASLLIALGEDPAYVMAQLGHTDPKFTLRLYAHMMRRRDGEKERLRALVEGAELPSMGTSARTPEDEQQDAEGPGIEGPPR